MYIPHPSLFFGRFNSFETHPIHLRRASRMVKGGGEYMFPLTYTGEVEEHLNTRKNVGIQDLSTMGEVDIKGPGAERLVNRLLVNDVYDLHPGQVRYSTMVNEDGGIVDDVTAYKFSDEHFMIVTSSGPRKDAHRWIAEHALGMSAYVTDITSNLALISVQGPRAREFLLPLVRDGEVETLKFFRFTNATIHETQLLISRSGYTGELSYELYVSFQKTGGNFRSLC